MIITYVCLFLPIFLQVERLSTTPIHGSSGLNVGKNGALVNARAILIGFDA
jgi:hypothetical protein